MMESLFSRATIVTMNPGRDVIDDGAVYVGGDRIQDVGFAAELETRYPRLNSSTAAAGSSFQA
jgi:5-methylthioadenosine/S-adenosylhomocysteine deaminase